MFDTTEIIRMELAKQLDGGSADREKLEKEFGQVWDTKELMLDFQIDGFAHPFVVVKRRTDNVVGTVVFQHSPRLFYSFTPD